MQNLMNLGFIFSFIIIISVLFHINTLFISNDIKLIYFKQSNQINEKNNLIRLEPLCTKCRPNIYLKKINFVSSNQNFNLYQTTHNNENIIYFSTNKTFSKVVSNLYPNKNIYSNPKLTCDLYNSFRYGPNQKVLSFSLYGSNYRFYKNVENLIKQAKLIYPDWWLRFYYNEQINKTIICDLECKYDKIYFCDINMIPRNDQNDLIELYTMNSSDLVIFKNYSYVHGMMWRWLPIIDDFVDYFSSRDIDSNLIQREKDSVDAWLKEKKQFHIMRDHPYHNMKILGGMWGHANILNRSNGNEIFNYLVQTSVQSTFNPQLKNPKNYDQNYLSLYIWPLAVLNSTIHDSYNCAKLGGEPFPTQRPSKFNCFVSCFESCCDSNSTNQENKMWICPLKCRPKDHQDWEYC